MLHLFDKGDVGSYEFVKEVNLQCLQFISREDLSFGIMVGASEKDSDSLVDLEAASDLACNLMLLYNEVEVGPEGSVEVLLKTIRTRTSRLLSEVGPNLGQVLEELQLKILWDNEE